MTEDQVIYEELRQAFRVSKKLFIGNKFILGETNSCYYTVEEESCFGEIVGIYTEKLSNRTLSFRVSLN